MKTDFKYKVIVNNYQNVVWGLNFGGGGGKPPRLNPTLQSCINAANSIFNVTFQQSTLPRLRLHQQDIILTSNKRTMPPMDHHHPGLLPMDHHHPRLLPTDHLHLGLQLTDHRPLRLPCSLLPCNNLYRLRRWYRYKSYLFSLNFCWTKVHLEGPWMPSDLDFRWLSSWVLKSGWISCLHTSLLVSPESLLVLHQRFS